MRRGRAFGTGAAKCDLKPCPMMTEGNRPPERGCSLFVSDFRAILELKAEVVFSFQHFSDFVHFFGGELAGLHALIEGRRTGSNGTSEFCFAHAAFQEGKMNVSELARVCGLSRPTVYKYMKMMG